MEQLVKFKDKQNIYLAKKLCAFQTPSKLSTKLGIRRVDILLMNREGCLNLDNKIKYQNHILEEK